MSFKPIFPKGLPRPQHVPYSPGALADNILYISGILPLDNLDKGGKTIGIGDAEIQTRQVIETIRAIVEEAGGTLSDVVYNSIFIRNLDDYAAMNKVYSEYFGENPPARYCIQANLVPPDCLIEISSVAHIAKQV